MQPASSRAYEKVTIQCGLLNVPVEIYSGLADFGIKRMMFHATTGQEIGQQLVLKVDGINTETIVKRDQTVRKVQTPAGFVYVEDGEIESLCNLVPKTVVVQGFYPMSQWERHNVAGEKLYFVEPTRTSRKVAGKTVKAADPSSQMGLGLLLTAMKDEGVFALVEWVSRGKPKPAVLLPDGQLWTIYYDEQLREQRPVEIPEDLPATAVGQARALVTAMTESEVPLLSDEYTLKIQAFADEKAAAGDFSQPDEVAAAAPTAAVFDLEAMLQASIDAANKKAS